MLVTLVVVFIICWCPRVIIELLYSIDETLQTELLDVVNVDMSNIPEVRAWLRKWSYLNSCINVIVYAITSKYVFLVQS